LRVRLDRLDDGFIELLFERRADLVVVNLQKPRVLPCKILGEYTARQPVKLIGFKSLQQVQPDFGLAGYLFETEAASETFKA